MTKPTLSISPSPAPGHGQAQLDLFGDPVDCYINAKNRYGVWPTTVWDCDASDAVTRRMKKLIGDDGEARSHAGAKNFGWSSVGRKGLPDKSIYRGKHVISIFSPAVASWVLNAYAPTQGICLDPFAGGGTRAVMAAKHGLRYVGCEIRQEECEAVMRRCERAECASSVRLLNIDCRTLSLPSEYADFLITCPPYYDLEQYEGGEGDLSMLPTYSDFVEALDVVVGHTRRILKRGAHSCWVVGLHRDGNGGLLPMHHDLARIHKDYGFRFKEEVILRQQNNGAIRRVGQFDKGDRRLVRVHEYLLVFVA